MRKEYIIVIVAIILIVAITTAYLYYMKYIGGEEEKELVIYTYQSLLACGPNPNQTWDKVFGGFERTYNVKVRIVKFSDAGEMLAKIIEEVKSGHVEADVVIGLDNIQIIKAKKEGVLEPYTPKNIGEIYDWLIQSYDPEHYAIPYDYGLIAFVYDTRYINESTIQDLTFEKFINTDLGKTLVVEDPRTSSTGLSFLLYEITVYEKYLGKDWRTWWEKVKPAVKKSWDDAFDAFENGEYHIMVSYATDPAYSVFFYNSTIYKATLVKYHGKLLGWLQIEGIGIVKGAKHPELAKKFIEWFLSKEVQEEIPLNNWMYPANKNVELPDVYKYAIDMNQVEVVNLKMPQEEIAENLDKWIEEWTTIMGQ